MRVELRGAFQPTLARLQIYELERWLKSKFWGWFAT